MKDTDLSRISTFDLLVEMCELLLRSIREKVDGCRDADFVGFEGSGRIATERARNKR